MTVVAKRSPGDADVAKRSWVAYPVGSAVSSMGIALDDEQLVFNLKSEMCLTELQTQRLDTTCGATPTQACVEREATRLFKSIHKGSTPSFPSSSHSGRSMLRRFTSSRPSCSNNSRPSSRGRPGRSRRGGPRTSVSEHIEREFDCDWGVP